MKEVEGIEESPSRLPAMLANKMYEAGESAMGGCFFTLFLSDARRRPCETGNAVDFVDLPSGVSPEMIIDLLPHEGRNRDTGSWGTGPNIMPAAHGADYSWCLYRIQH
jgi:hypothetical protein